MRILLLLLLLISSQSYGQSTTFTVKKEGVDVRLHPSYGVLFKDVAMEISFKLNGEPLTAPYKVRGSGGKLEQKDSLYLLTAFSEDEVLLEIIDTSTPNNDVIAYRKISVLNTPQISVGGVTTDSVNINLSFVSNPVYAWCADVKKKIPVKSFKISYFKNKKQVTAHVEGDRLTKNLRQDIYSLKEGSLVVLDSLRVEFAPNYGAYLSGYQTTILKVEGEQIRSY